MLSVLMLVVGCLAPSNQDESPLTPDGTDTNALEAECIEPTDCPGVDEGCQFRACTDGQCGTAFVQAGSPALTGQTPGDCQTVVCDGAGGARPISDDTDLPVDGEQCTDDVCVDGKPSNPDTAAGTECGKGLICDGVGRCVDCLVASDCGDDTFCREYSCLVGVCEASVNAVGTPLPAGEQTGSDCQELQCGTGGEIVAVNDDADVPADDGNDCTVKSCEAGTPTITDQDADIACNSNGGSVCDGSGTCVECNSPGQCSGANACRTTTCVSNVCGTQNVSNGTSCDDGLYCNGSETCQSGVCESGPNPCPGADGDSDCSESCNETLNNCTANDAAGTSCSDGLFCTSGDTCNGSGTCNGGSSNPCPGSDGDSDCTETCDEGTNSCTAADPDGGFCGACPPGTTNCGGQTCLSGVCTATPAGCPSGGGACP